MLVNCKDRIVPILYVQHEPSVMLQNRQSHELINNATTIWLIEFGKNLVWWSLYKYKCLWGVRGKGWDLSLQEGTSHSYILRWTTLINYFLTTWTKKDEDEDEDVNDDKHKDDIEDVYS